jgi:hypothetical protein
VEQPISRTAHGTASDRYFPPQLNLGRAPFRSAPAILIALAFVPQIGFAEAFPRLLLIGSVFCALWGITEREKLLSPALTHWDEAAALVIMSKLVTAIL